MHGVAVQEEGHMHLVMIKFILITGLGLFHLQAQAETNGLSEDLLNQEVGLSTLQEKVVLTITGLIHKTNYGTEARFDLPMLQALPASQLETHTLITDGLKHFDGVLMRDLLKAVAVDESATLVLATALNDYQVKIPISDFYQYDVLLATHMDGQVLLPTGKGPLWIVYPRDQFRHLQDIRFDYKWVWQLSDLYVY